MEENENNFKILSKCAEIAEIVKSQKNIKKPSVIFKLDSSEFLKTLIELEEAVRIRVDRSQNQVSINISGTEFTFKKD